MNIHFLSASDRLNYGDLLFPLIFKIVVIDNSNFSFYNYGLVNSNLTKFGALKTDSFIKLESRIKKNPEQIHIIIIGGGHCMFPSWSILYSHINYFYNKLIKINACRKLLNRLNIPRRFFTSSSSISPFAPLLDAKVIFNSVGGSVNEKIDSKTFNLLKKSPALNVRDEYLLNQLQKIKLNPNLVPDTATIIADIWPITKLDELVSDECKMYKNFKYVFVQLGLNKSPSDILKFVNNLIYFEEKGFLILCSPIGIATGHEDTVELKKLVRLNSKFQYYFPKNLFETMYLIACSSTYIGTSLHGCITSYAYNIPFIPINSKVKKLKNYVNTWWSDFLNGIIDYDELDVYLKKQHFNFNKNKALLNLEHDKKKVYKSLSKIKLYFENFT